MKHKTFGRNLLVSGLVAICGFAAQAQPITPVWEHLVNNLPAPLPILTNALPWTTDLENGDGLSLMDCIGPMRRYDASRLLLGVRENGIDESVAHNTSLAAAYPDRSLIWINPTNGVPMGLALNMGLFPVPLDPSTQDTNVIGDASPGVPGSYYWSFDVSSDGYVYSGYKNMIIRYAPNGSGGISPTPVVVFNLDANTATNNGISAAAWANFRWQHVRVRGAGASTVILAGGGGARGVWLLTTANGNLFTAGAHINGTFGNAAGNISNFIPDPNGTSPGDITFYGGSYPNNSSGADTYLYKAKASPPYDNPANLFIADAAFVAQPDPNTNLVTRYFRLFQGSCDAHPDLDFVVNYSTPPYNPTMVGGDQPGWIAIHNRTNGQFVASYQLPVSAVDEFLTDDASPLFMSCFGSVSLYPLADGTAEVLWTSEVYGYGRYIIGSPRYTRSMAMSKTITPLWEQLQGQTNLSLPIIDTDVNPNPVPADGASVMHMFTGLKKYDATRFLLGVRDNGINETVVHNTNLARQYPDRSLQWIDAYSGKPLGTALVIDYPAGTVGDDNHLNMAFGVAEDGVVYVGVGNAIRRYAPRGSSFAEPTIAFTATNGVVYADQIQFSQFRVSGGGASTVMVVGHRDWYGDTDRVLETADGLTFTEVVTVPTDSGISSVVPDPANPSDNLIYKSKFPATSNGIDATLERLRQAGGLGDFVTDPWSVEQVNRTTVTNSVDVIYRTYFLTDVQALPGTDWVLASGAPSFQTFDGTVQSFLKGNSPNPMPYQPGWLAIHDQVTGEVRGLRKLNVTEALNVVPGTTAPPADFYSGWFLYAIPQGGVELYPVLNSAAELAGVEILWWSATYGFGRYYVDTPPARIIYLRGTKVGSGVKLEWSGDGVLQSADRVDGPYADVVGATSPYLYPGPATKFFRLRL